MRDGRGRLPRRLEGLLVGHLLFGRRRGRGGPQRRVARAEARPAGRHQLLPRWMVARRHEDRVPAARWVGDRVRDLYVEDVVSGRVTRVTEGTRA